MAIKAVKNLGITDPKVANPEEENMPTELLQQCSSTEIHIAGQTTPDGASASTPLERHESTAGCQARSEFERIDRNVLFY